MCMCVQSPVGVSSKPVRQEGLPGSWEAIGPLHSALSSPSQTRPLPGPWAPAGMQVTGERAEATAATLSPSGFPKTPSSILSHSLGHEPPSWALTVLIGPHVRAGCTRPVAVGAQPGHRAALLSPGRWGLRAVPMGLSYLVGGSQGDPCLPPCSAPVSSSLPVPAGVLVRTPALKPALGVSRSPPPSCQDWDAPPALLGVAKGLQAAEKLGRKDRGQVPLLPGRGSPAASQWP